jgi:hypothetical protein
MAAGQLVGAGGGHEVIVRVDLPAPRLSRSRTSAASLGCTRAAAKNSRAAKLCPPEAVLSAPARTPARRAGDLARREIEIGQFDALSWAFWNCARGAWLATPQATRPAANAG